MSTTNSYSIRIRFIFLTIISSFIFSPAVSAQVLEEIVVTAQRREQNLQEVPISINAITGPELTRQGFRSMEDLGQFAPSVEMNESLHEWSVTIRGMGNDVANMSVEQSAPIFADGIHLGRPSMIKGAFMDVERVEVLRGPQPVYFGQNATAGAFSITTRKPTEEWEGNFTTEVGNFGRINVDGGFGGPLSDTIGFRLAGKWDHTSGHLTDVFSGDKFPNRTDSGARLSTVWRPTENLEFNTKVEYMRRRSNGDTNTVCRSRGIPKQDQLAVLIPGFVPEFTDDIIPLPNCAADGFQKIGISEGDGNFPATIDGINNDDARSGQLDIREQARAIMPDGNLNGREPVDAWTVRLAGLYELSNGISIEGIFGLIDYDRESFESSDESPYLMEAAFRNEDFKMRSGEIRVTSPSGGQIEWTAGAYYQAEQLDLDPVNTLRANIRRPLRQFHPYGDSEWVSAFASFTFNFFDDKASLDIGGRYTDVKKDGGITAGSATWIFDIDPDPDGDGIVEATEHKPAANGGDNVRNDVAEAIISCETGLDVRIPASSPNTNLFGRPIAFKQCGQYAGMAGFWTHEWRESDVPDVWDNQAPIDIGPALFGINRRTGPFQDSYNEDAFDPQITLRYRPTPNHSLYVKYANAFKAGGFDTSDRGMPDGGLFWDQANPGEVGRYGDDGQDAFQFNAEHADNYEIGARGILFDNRVRYGVTLFSQKIKDLQIETPITDFAALLAGGSSSGRGQVNAGAQRTRGVEFDFTWAATDRLTYQMAGVIQKGVVLDFQGGCTDIEALAAATGPCFTRQESEDLTGSRALEGLIDRSGTKSPRTPDWKFIFGTDYEYPIADRFISTFNTKVAVSDGYTEDTLGFSQKLVWPVHADWNMLVGIGDVEQTWDINFYARNLLGARQIYQPEFDPTEQGDHRGIQTDDTPQSSFFNYGIQFNYYFR